MIENRPLLLGKLYHSVSLGSCKLTDKCDYLSGRTWTSCSKMND